MNKQLILFYIGAVINMSGCVSGYFAEDRNKYGKRVLYCGRIFKDGHSCHCRTKKDVRSCIIEYCCKKGD